MFPPKPSKPCPDDESKNPAPEDTPDPRPHDKLRAHRLERFMHLGFSFEDAELLAAARADSGFHLDWQVVAKQLGRGMTHHHAVLIYA